MLPFPEVVERLALERPRGVLPGVPEPHPPPGMTERRRLLRSGDEPGRLRRVVRERDRRDHVPGAIGLEEFVDEPADQLGRIRRVEPDAAPPPARPAVLLRRV